MKLYMHPVSTATRPVRLFIAENDIKCDEELVDILQGAHYQEPYASLNRKEWYRCWRMTVFASRKARPS